jgi:hypothetical protein
VGGGAVLVTLRWKGEGLLLRASHDLGCGICGGGMANRLVVLFRLGTSDIF